MINKSSKIYVAGHRGLVGSAIVKRLDELGYKNIIKRTHNELDLTDSVGVADFFKEERPDFVFLAAAKVGGIVANNTYRAEFLYENLMIQNNVIHQSYLNNVKKLLFLGSTCIYPKECPQPMREDYLLTGELEYTNEPYAIAKIAGIKMCESYNLQYGTNFMSVMPTNLYGPNDNFDLEKSHVLPAMIRKIHLGKLISEGKIKEAADNLGVPEDESTLILAKYGITADNVEIWGSGLPMREFLWSEDMADACVYIMNNHNFKDCYTTGKPIKNTHINIGTGKDISIKELAFLVKKIVGYSGGFVFNTSKPDGTMKKLTDCTKLNNLGWMYKTDIQEGITKLYNWMLASQ